MDYIANDVTVTNFVEKMGKPVCENQLKDDCQETSSIKNEYVTTNNIDSKINTFNESADIETAITATGYGRFHMYLLLVSMPVYWSFVAVTSTIPFTLTAAECDLNISLMNRGLLTSMTYIGMLVSAIFWGYLSDTLGRSKIIVIGNLMLGTIEFVGSLSQTFWMLVTSKFFAGFVLNGSCSVMITYISELHSYKMRSRMVIMSGIFYSFGSITLPLIAWGVIPQDWTFSFFEGAFVLHSWNIFLAISSVPPLLGSLAALRFPESPKFLMSRGRNDEALKVLKYIYSKNTGEPSEKYPIKFLVDASQSKKPAASGWEAVKGGFGQMAPLVSKPYFAWLSLLCFINLAALFGGNTIRMWFPQIAGMLDDYTSKHSEPVGLCEVLAIQTNKTLVIIDDDRLIKECVKLTTGASTYVNSMIIGISSAIGHMVSGLVVNRIGNLRLAMGCFSLSFFCPLALPWLSTGVTETVALFSIFLATSGSGGVALSSVIVDLFPTQSRAMAVAIFMSFGRIGTIAGNVTFPTLLQTGCRSTFLTIAATTFVSALGCLTLHKNKLKNMKKQLE